MGDIGYSVSSCYGLWLNDSKLGAKLALAHDTSEHSVLKVSHFSPDLAFPGLGSLLDRA